MESGGRGGDDDILMESGMERLVHMSESVLELAARIGSRRRLVVKTNYVTDLMVSHRSRTLCISGHLNYSKVLEVFLQI